jgi:hypothetical protein
MITMATTTRPGDAGARLLRVLTVAAMTLMASLASTPVANAALDITDASASISATAAGSHADVAFSVSFGRDPVTGSPYENVRRLGIALPPGMAANARDTPTCSQADFMTFPTPSCPAASQVGTGVLREPNPDGDPAGPILEDGLRIYNVEPPPGEPARLGVAIDLPGLTLAGSFVDVRVRDDSDFGITSTVTALAQAREVLGLDMTLWGVPADHGVPTAPKPFMVNPTDCGPAASIAISADSYADPGTFDHVQVPLPAFTECQAVPFEPSISVQPDSRQPDVPTGLAVELSVPQSDDPKGRYSSALKDARVVLPEGMSLSPSAADGLRACSDAQLDMASGEDASCPLASKIGTVRLETPLLRAPLTGSIFVGEQKVDDPYRVFVVANGLDTTLKLEGSIAADPETGRLTATFGNNPKVPFSRLSLKFKGGPRAPLANPPTCGVKAVTAHLDAWSERHATPSDSFVIDCPGLGAFTPSLQAGTVSPVAAGFSPFVLRIDRADREQYLSGVSLDLPEGLLAKLGGVPPCADKAAATGACPSESRVGTATIGAGPGSSPFFLNGGVFLTGPYKGAPYGLAVVVRAIAGPYDLGTVVVRQALHVDSEDAHVTVVSDPLPTILKGIPLRLRSIDVDIDRPGFTVNPTSCAPARIDGTLTSTGGAGAAVSSRFQVGDCAALPFAPKLALRLTGKAQRAPGRHPGLRAVLTQPAGQANLEAVKVKLPKSVALDPENANALCSYEDGLRATCGEDSRIGTATAYSPLLSRPLAGPVHFVQGIRFDRETGERIRTLPTLLLKLRGEVAIDLRARSSAPAGRLVATFSAIPDTPVSKFSLRLRPGDGGILAVTGERSLCSARQAAFVQTDGQNGKQRDFLARIKTPCSKAKGRRSGR